MTTHVDTCLMARYLKIALFFASIYVYGHAEILIGPQNTEAETEETVELHCEAPWGAVEWQHLPLGAPHPELVYKDGFFYIGYKQRFSVKRISNGTNVLIIRNVKPTDAGKFICLEDAVKPSRSAAELIVFERVPSNESCVGKYTCKPVCSELELSCEMKAHGNHIPSMQWIDSEGRHLDSMLAIVNETHESTVMLKANPCITVSFTLRLTYQGIELTSKYGWTFSKSAAKDASRLSQNSDRSKTPKCTQGSTDEADSELNNFIYNTDSDSRHPTNKGDCTVSSLMIVIAVALTTAVWNVLFVIILMLIMAKFKILKNYPQLENLLDNNQLPGRLKNRGDNIQNDSVVSPGNLKASNDANVGEQSEDSL